MSDLSKYVDKKVKLVHNLSAPNEKGETAEELEGTVEAVAGDAIMFRPKGKTGATIIEVSAIESIDFADATAKKLSRRTLKVVKFGQARNHLLERHGFTLAKINGLSEKEAFELHEAIDHEASDLGHVHKDTDEKAASEEDNDSDD